MQIKDIKKWSYTERLAHKIGMREGANEQREKMLGIVAAYIGEVEENEGKDYIALSYLDELNARLKNALVS